jgi:hypothetical protein
MSTLTSGNVTVSCSLSADTTGNLVFQSGGNVTAMTIDSSQNVGIGTSSLSNGVRSVIQGSQTGGAPQTSGTTQTYGILRLQGTSFTSCLDFGTNGGNYAWIQSTDTTNLGTNYDLAINPNGGNLLVNLTASVSGKLQVKNSDGGYGTGIALVESGTSNYWSTLVYTVNHDLYLGYNGTNKGYFSSSTGAYTATSDRTLKKDISAIGYGLAEILNLKPSSYLMKSENDGSTKHLGFIAQEVKDVLPEAVSEMKGGLLGLETTAIVPVLVKAIQEQQQMIETLQAKVAALEGASA